MAQCVSIALSSQFVSSCEQPSPAVVLLSLAPDIQRCPVRTCIVVPRSVSSLLATRFVYCTTTFDSDSLPAGQSGFGSRWGRYFCVLEGKPQFSCRITAVVGKGCGSDAMRRAVVTHWKHELLYCVCVEFPNLCHPRGLCTELLKAFFSILADGKSLHSKKGQFCFLPNSLHLTTFSAPHHILCTSAHSLRLTIFSAPHHIICTSPHSLHLTTFSAPHHILSTSPYSSSQSTRYLG